MAKEETKVISVRLDVDNYEKLQKMAVINKSTISAVASEVINSSFDDIERVISASSILRSLCSPFLII